MFADMCSMIRYTVVARPRTAALAADFVRWLKDEHGRELLAVPGCRRYELLEVGPLELHCEYLFESRAALDRYLAEDAPALRAKGRARFPEGTVVFERREARLLGRGEAALDTPPNGEPR